MSDLSPMDLGNPGSPAFVVAHFPFYQLNRAAGRYNGLMEQVLRPLGLDLPAWRVLMILGEESPRSITQISDIAVVNLSTMTRTIQKMAREGQVIATPRPGDRRVTEVHLTRTGKEALKRVRSIASDIYAQATAEFSASDLVHLKLLLDRLYRNLGSASLNSAAAAKGS